MEGKFLKCYTQQIVITFDRVFESVVILTTNCFISYSVWRPHFNSAVWYQDRTCYYLKLQHSCLCMYYFSHLTGFRTTILPQLWRGSSNLGAEIKPWLSLPGFQFCIALSCAKGLFLMRWHRFIIVTISVFHTCLYIQEGYQLCLFTASQTIALMKSVIQNMRLNF